MNLSYSLRMTIICSAVLMCQNSIANEPWSQDRQWLLGDWNGNRQALLDQGYKFNTSIITESATNVDGGYNDDNKLLHAYTLTLGTALDLEKIAGWKDTEASVVITKRDGQSLSGQRIADPRAGHFSNTQETYGRGQNWRLTQAWIKKGFMENTLQVKAGRMGLNEDFGGSQCEFQNLLLCGNQVGKTNGSIWYNFPVSGWAANVKYQFAPEWSVATGLYEINPENMLENRGFNLMMDETSGAIIPLEVVWKPKLNDLAGEYKLGGFYANVDVTDVKNNEEHQRKHGIWAGAQQQLTARDGDKNRGLFASVSLVVNDKSTAQVEATQQLAVWYKGPFDSRPKDSIGLGIIHLDVNDRVRDAQNLKNELNGLTVSDYSNSLYQPIQHNEVNVELNYTYRWSPAVMFRPNIQYIFQPGGVKEVDNAWVAGLTMQLNF
ncbi:MAG: carbohydrate porin [Candidatus Acinetobacter avistercoris]|uniref:carbohydrate porin n=1 Tax=Acinetobacter sp. KS-LM10 TaxID=3120518 RepID=UPI001F851AC9|nr:carbohydrate porin [Candidatus Acinetobacter avistercoris]